MDKNDPLNGICEFWLFGQLTKLHHKTGEYDIDWDNFGEEVDQLDAVELIEPPDMLDGPEPVIGEIVNEMLEQIS